MTLFRSIFNRAGQALFQSKRAVQYLDQAIHPDKFRALQMGLEAMPPMHVRIDAALEATPQVNVLLPRLGIKYLTGGPNTAINIAYGLASLGISVRLLALDQAVTEDHDTLWRHISSVGGTGDARPAISFGSTIDPKNPAHIGPADTFIATYWTTAFRLKPILPQMKVPEFVYLIQDFEPGFYPWSSRYAQALESYGMRYRAIINESLLAEYLVQSRTGRFAEVGFAASCLVFEPAVDRGLFYPVQPGNRRKRLLFYARPTRARNLFGIGFEALRAASTHAMFANDDWDFVAIGDASLDTMDLGSGRRLEPAPWLGFEDYARMIRESDILLCPMLSPHTSYPVLEMAACRGITVTNTFGSKTSERLSAISASILSGPPTIEAFSLALIEAAERLSLGGSGASDISLPLDWPTALQSTLAATRERFHKAVSKARLES